MKYFCPNCGNFLKKSKSSKPTVRFYSYKVLIVKTETHYKCANGCELKSIESIKTETQ